MIANDIVNYSDCDGGKNQIQIMLLEDIIWKIRE